MRNKRLLALLVAGAAPATLASWMVACSQETVGPHPSGDGDSGATADVAVDAPEATGEGGTADARGNPADATSDSSASDAPPGDGGVPSDASLSDCYWDQNPDAQPDVYHPPSCGNRSGQKVQATWFKMDEQPIVPPGAAGGVDFLVDGGLSVGEAEQTLCQATYLGDLFGDCTVTYAWGDNDELLANVDPNNGAVRFLSVGALGPGYLGAVSFAGPDGGASFVIPTYTQIQKNGQNFTLDVGWQGATFDDEVDELYRGLIATFAPSVAQDPPGTTCVSTKKCFVGFFGSVGYVYIPSIGFAFWSADVNAQPSIPNRLDLYAPK
jgi:hypothetical protein